MDRVSHFLEPKGKCEGVNTMEQQYVNQNAGCQQKSNQGGSANAIAKGRRLGGCGVLCRLWL